jgi:FdhD protein
VKIHKGESNTSREDLIALEEPLEIRLGYGPVTNRQQKSIAVTMRTPGHDMELALGFLFSEDIIQSMDDIESIHYCEDLDSEEEKENVVRAELGSHVRPDFEKLERNFFVTSSCGICGKTSIDSIKTYCEKLPDGIEVDRNIIYELVKRMEIKQQMFGVTGGLHASGIFDQLGELMILREDVGRHNALDKLTGAFFQKRKLPLSESILLLSGRAGFELVQKAIRSGIPILAAVGAPSSLAVSLAQEFDLTLIGFLKDQSFNIYSGEHRIK